MLKGTKLYSIFNGKCPRCHKGDFYDGLFFKANPLKECSHCKLKYEKEPGFFQGSYYVTYALGVATIVTVWVAMYVLFPKANFDHYLWGVLGTLIVLTPIIYPLSKIIWANFFTSYESEYNKD